MSSLVELSRIAAGFPGKPILAELTLSVGKGELVLIEGAIGAGKTTLIRVMLGAQPLLAGRGEMAGITLPVSATTKLTELRRKIGVVFQSPRFLAQESVLTNVSLPLAICGESASQCRAAGTRALMDVGLMNHVRKRPGSLSGGEMARLQIARALIHQPSLLLADEPFAHLDPDSAAEAETLLAAAHSRGMAIVLTSHRPTGLADRATKYRLESGRLVGASA